MSPKHKIIFLKTALTILIEFQQFFETVFRNKTAAVVPSNTRTRGPDAKCRFCWNGLYRSDVLHSYSVFSNQQWAAEQQSDSFPRWQSEPIVCDKSALSLYGFFIYVCVCIVACRAVTVRRPRVGQYTRDVSRQRLGKHVPAATNRCETIEVLLETGCFYVVRAEESSWRQLGRASQFSSVRESVKSWLERVKLKNLHC
jgi:hypothetical protein